MKKYNATVFSVLSIGLLFFSINRSHSQKLKTDVVYGGRGFTWGLQMSSYDLVVLFRSDGTFCNRLEDTDWQTKIDGRYKRTNDKIVMEYLDGAEENDTIFFKRSKKGNRLIFYKGAQMVKMKIANTIPEGFYEFSKASSSGGMGTGSVYVGTQKNKGYNFYKNGTFDRSSSSGVFLSGKNVGGGSGSESSGKGKYTMEQGLLTLKYDDGTITKSSFFYSRPDDGDEGVFMTAINGSIFFSGMEEEESTTQNSTVKTSKEVTNRDAESVEQKGMQILRDAKLVHGGQALDRLKTIEADIVFSGLSFKVSMDFERSYLQLESTSPSFNYVEQLEGNEGWVHQNNVTTSLSKARREELRMTFYTGLFGLRDQVLNQLKIRDVVETKDDLLLVLAQMGTHKMGYVVDKKDKVLVAAMVPKNGKSEITYYSNLKKDAGLLLPFTETTEGKDGNTVVKYTQYRINPNFTDNDWQMKK